MVDVGDLTNAWQFVPHECPFCRVVDDLSWQEFKVFVAYPHYFDSQHKKEVECGEPEYRVICTRCSEDIIPEDMGDD